MSSYIQIDYPQIILNLAWDGADLPLNMALFFRNDLPDGIKAPVGSPWNGLPNIVGSGPDVVEVDFGLYFLILT